MPVPPPPSLPARLLPTAPLAYLAPRFKLVGSSAVMQEVRRLIAKLATTNATILVRGPSGSGKELVAMALHRNSYRYRPSGSAYVCINCANLQDGLCEAELFGRVKGAYTGAESNKGLVASAAGGTLFIDEVGELSPGNQAKLLRFLDSGRYRSVGSTEEQLSDVRLVAATNRPLEADIEAKRFREDLFYRLNVVTVTLPPLCERRDDIAEITNHILTTRRPGERIFDIDHEALAALERYSWPGNVRQLAHALERAQLLADEPIIRVADLPPEVLQCQ